MTGPLCDAVTGGKDSGGAGATVLDQLRRRNLFIVPLDDEGQWFRYHHLFRQVLRQELARRIPQDEIAGLLRRASAWFAQHGWLEEALQAALNGGDIAAATGIVVDHRQELIGGDNLQLLDRCVRLFPSSAVAADPDLLLFEAWLMHGRGQHQAVSANVDRAEALVTAAGDAQVARRLEGEIHALRAYDRYWADDAAGLLDHARLALAKAPSDAWCIRLVAVQAEAIVHQWRGEFGRAHDLMVDLMATEAFQVRRRRVHLMEAA